MQTLLIIAAIIALIALMIAAWQIKNAIQDLLKKLGELIDELKKRVADIGDKLDGVLDKFKELEDCDQGSNHA